MLWAPLQSLNQAKRSQFCFTTAAGDQHFLQHYTDNGTNIRNRIEHAFNFPMAAQNLPLNDNAKATCFALTLLPPASGVHQQVLTEQQAAVADPNADINLQGVLMAYIERQLGDHGTKAAYRQLQGLKSIKKPRSVEVFEWDSLFFTGNCIVA